MITENNEIQVAIEEWGLYNAGILACKWWNTNNTVEEVKEYFIKLRKKHGVYPIDDLELFNADYEGSSLIDEDTSFEKVLEISDTLEALDETDQKKINYLMDYNSSTLEEALENYEDVEIYEDMNMLELAEMFIDETWEVPDHLVNYIDVQSFAYDLAMDYTEIDNDIFRSA